ncbi:MAG: hypothetical protein JSS10_00770 [Verrucomicrobia bacterium]|nr:hypothetical protein [Verrucomicrobiota bacterium]
MAAATSALSSLTPPHPYHAYITAEMKEIARKIVDLRAKNMFHHEKYCNTPAYRSWKIQYWVEAFAFYAKTSFPHDRHETYREIHALSQPWIEPYQPDLLIKFGALLGYKVDMGVQTMDKPRQASSQLQKRMIDRPIERLFIYN